MSIIKKLLFSILLSLSFFSMRAQSARLVNQPVNEGTCIAKAKQPIPYKTIKQQVLVAEESVSVLEELPAEYETIEVGIMVYDGPEGMCTESEVYDVIDEEFIVKEGYFVIREDYKEIEEVEMEDSYSRWEQRKDIQCKSPSGDCDVAMQWVESPAKPKISQTKQFIKRERIEYVEPETIIIRRVVRKNPELTRIIKIPGKYTTIERKKLKKDAYIKMLHKPAKYKEIDKKVFTKNTTDESIWVTILCPNEVDGFVYGQIQLALKARDYHISRVNGIWGKNSQYALEKYQTENNLPIGKLDQETVESLGLNFDMIVNNSKKQNQGTLSASAE